MTHAAIPLGQPPMPSQLPNRSAYAMTTEAVATTRFCKFCGEFVDAPCVDDTDLSIYSRTVERCADAHFNRLAEDYYEHQDDNR